LPTSKTISDIASKVAGRRASKRRVRRNGNLRDVLGAPVWDERPRGGGGSWVEDCVVVFVKK
jgi:hypothetical protein